MCVSDVINKQKLCSVEKPQLSIIPLFRFINAIRGTVVDHLSAKKAAGMCCEVPWAGEIHGATLISLQCSLEWATTFNGSTGRWERQVCPPLCLSVYLSVRQSVSQLVSLSPFLSVSHSLCFFSISPSRSLRLFKKTHQINISPSKYLYSFKYHSTTSRSGEGLERTWSVGEHSVSHLTVRKWWKYKKWP